MVLVTLVCCNFGLWEATKRQGVDDVLGFALSALSTDAQIRDPHLAMYSVSVEMPSAKIP